MDKLSKSQKEVLSFFNAKTRCRYNGVKGRCNNPNNKDFKYYGGRGVKANITLEQFRELWLSKIEELGYNRYSYDDLVEVFNDYQVDRIDGNGDYEISNIELIKAMPNEYASGKNYHVLLKRDENGELWCPCSLFDYVLDRRYKSAKNALLKGYFRNITISKRYYLDFLYINPNEPPVPIDKDFCIQCFTCGERVKLNGMAYKYLYKCKKCKHVAKARMNFTKTKFDDVSKKDFDKCLEYLYQHLRRYDGKTKAPKDG